jgi:phosphoribosylglycinamide formyltransferase-1
MNIAVFASTNGTDFQAILEEHERGKLPGVKICFLLTNKKDCGAVVKAKNHNIPVIFVDPKGKGGGEYDEEISKICLEQQIDLICLVGWMRILSPRFVGAFKNRVINVHPSLLPKYPGMDLNVHAEVLKNKERETGMTIHFVTAEVDKGPILIQKSLPVLANDTPESLKTRVQALEKVWYPEAIRMLAAKGKQKK